jgi:hypothetical protein
VTRAVRCADKGTRKDLKKQKEEVEEKMKEKRTGRE